MRARSLVARVVRVVVMLCLMAPGATSATSSSRIALLAADTGHLYYGPDPGDPEAPVSTIRRHCPGRISGVPNAAQPCLSSPLPIGGAYIHTLFWMPAAVFTTPATWSSGQPLRFHLELEVENATPHTVHLGVQKGVDIPESAAASEVSPGVFEGSLSAGSPLGVAGSVDLIFIRIRTPAPAITLSMKAAGASYVELPSPAQVKSVPELLAEHTYHPSPGSFATAQRRFWFNDGEWETASFQGDLTGSRQFDLPLDRRAASVIAWVEAFETPLVYDVARGEPPEPRKLTTSPVIRLLQDGQELSRGGNNGGNGRGVDAVAATDVGPGTVSLEVAPPSTGEHTSTYAAHILVVYGARTLERMRWSFQIDHEGNIPAYRAANSGFCPGGYEVVPTTTETTTFSMDLDWDTGGLPDPGFTIRFNLPTVGAFGCGEAGAGDRMRITVPGRQVWYVGATPAPGRTFVSWRDTVFEMDVRFAYTAAPAAA